MHTTSVSLAVLPTVVSTFFKHYLNHKPLRQRPTALLSYDEGLHLVRTFLAFASTRTVEEVQAFTSQWVPHPHWVKVEEATVPEVKLAEAANLLREQLGPEGIRKVGGKQWWQWRKSALKAEWIEMRAEYNERKKKADPGNRVMFYVHGGGYFFGSVDEHRYQMQRHARKLKARVFAPRYRLAPQFPFPCGLQDCLAAYLHLLTYQEPQNIILAGDSAGGGMVVSMLVTMRDQGIPLPAGAILISPWADLTHSFPSVAGECPLDYLPPGGFHHKPSEAWPPPDEEELEQLKKLVIEQKTKDQASVNSSDTSSGVPGSARSKNGKASDGTPTVEDIAQKTHRLSLVIDGKPVEVKEQIQMYTTNELLAHPLVSPVMQPTLGGLPPVLVVVGGGEMLRDEQIYLAHKFADPKKYVPPEAQLDDIARAQIKRYKPTDVKLEVWDDLCHVATTLSFTQPAKYIYRSIAQFGAFLLARAQRTEVDIPFDDDISVISGSGSDSSDADEQPVPNDLRPEGSVGKAGDPLPPFINHMIRHRVTRHGDVFPLGPACDLPGCSLDRDLVGVIKVGPVKKWMEQKQHWETRFYRHKVRVHQKRLEDMVRGFEGFGDGELPPPSALAGRRKAGADLGEKKRTRSLGLALWSLWGSKHDEKTVERERQAGKEAETRVATPAEGKEEAKPVNDDGKLKPSTESGEAVDNPPVLTRQALNQDAIGESSPGKGLLDPSSATGVTGKRPKIGGIAMPFSLGKEADTASMITLNSTTSPSRQPSPRPKSPATGTDRLASSPNQPQLPPVGTPQEEGGAPVGERPGLETFTTAAEELPKANRD